MSMYKSPTDRKQTMRAATILILELFIRIIPSSKLTLKAAIIACCLSTSANISAEGSSPSGISFIPNHGCIKS